MDFPNNRKSPLFLALVLGLSLGVTGCSDEDAQKPATTAADQTAANQNQGEVAATVNGEPITEEELSEYRSLRPSSGAAPGRAELLDELITRQVVYQDALRKGLDQDPEVLKELEQLRTRVLVSAAVRKAMEDNPVSDEELKADYDKLKDRMITTEYKARHILVKEEDEAKALIKQLDQGADFAELAKKHSTGPTNKRGGDLGWFNPQQMVPEFSQALQQLEKGSYTKEPVKTQFGWHVIKLEDTRQTEPPAFEQMKSRLEKMAQQRKVGEYIEALKKSAKISIKDDAETSKDTDASAVPDQDKADASAAPAEDKADASAVPAEEKADAPSEETNTSESK